MNKKEKSNSSKARWSLKLAQPKPFSLFKKRLSSPFSLRPVIPHLLVIAFCVGLYYAMIHFYLFFNWGIYIYYLIKLIVAFEILSASLLNPWVPLCALLLGLAPLLFTNSLFLNTLMNSDTAWQLFTVGLIGTLIALSLALGSRKK